jgi:hypothetical protein
VQFEAGGAASVADVHDVGRESRQHRPRLLERRLVAADERQLARNLVGQFTVYATGAPVGFADRAKVEAVLDGAKAGRYGVRDLVRGLVTSELFLNK